MSSGRDVGLKRPNLRPKPVNVQCRWYHTTVDGDHGRIETRTCTVSTDVSDALDTGLDLGDPPLGSGRCVP
jgi:hypothetical protein